MTTTEHTRRPEPAFLEVVERVRPPREVATDGVGAVVRPNEVRINGVPLLVPQDEPVVIERISVGEDFALATITLYVKRVVMAQESGEPAPSADAAPAVTVAPRCGDEGPAPAFTCTRGVGHPGVHEIMLASGSRMTWGTDEAMRADRYATGDRDLFDNDEDEHDDDPLARSTPDADGDEG